MVIRFTEKPVDKLTRAEPDVNPNPRTPLQVMLDARDEYPDPPSGKMEKAKKALASKQPTAKPSVGKKNGKKEKTDTVSVRLKQSDIDAWKANNPSHTAAMATVLHEHALKMGWL